MSGKRKRMSVLLDVKRRTLKRLDAGESIKQIAKELGVGGVTAGDWRRENAKIEKWSAGDLTPDDCLKNRRTMRESDYKKTSEVLFMWFSQQRSKGMPISGSMLQEKAIYFCQKMKEADNFSVSTEWLNRRKKKKKKGMEFAR
ncbi:hypothetical protein AVEN_92086-1 [Araneus ventricosus]|uniref:HTH CENPB-type domain-containing protein n=1 Tax=Araneus ventricosus TaxID=182803 RepID=A0A4Y2HHD4_ARAVE|nr:hypothetical protein AVEN_92086-1 [Araneus ventricosus]